MWPSVFSLLLLMTSWSMTTHAASECNCDCGCAPEVSISEGCDSCGEDRDPPPPPPITTRDIEADESMKKLVSNIDTMKQSNTDAETDIAELRIRVAQLESKIDCTMKENETIRNSTQSLCDYAKCLSLKIVTSLKNVNIPSLQDTTLTTENLDSAVLKMVDMCNGQATNGGSGLFTSIKQAMNNVQLINIGGTVGCNYTRKILQYK